MAAKPGQSPNPNQPPPNGEGHNSQGPLTQKDLDDLQLVHMAEMRQHNDALEKAMEAVRGVRKMRTRHRTVVRTDGFPIALMDEMLEDEELPLHEVKEREAKRSHMRGVANQPGGKVSDLPLIELAQEKVNDEARWRGHGYTVGLRGADPDPTKYEVPGDMLQAWEEERRRGTSRLEEAFITKHRIEGTTPEPKPDKPPEEGAAAAAGEPEPSETGSGDGASGASEPESSPSTANDAFTEATDEELAAQNARKAIQEAREGEPNGSASDPATISPPADPNELPCEFCGAAPGELCKPDCTNPHTSPEPEAA